MTEQQDQQQQRKKDSDTVFIRGLRADAIIGIYDWERNTRQNLILDLEMATDISRAAASEDITDAIDYEKISNRILAFVSDSEFQLIETLAERVAALVIEEFGVSWLRLTVHKHGAIEFADDVGVTITRSSN